MRALGSRLGFLGSLGLLGLLVAACSTNPPNPPPDTGASDAGIDAGTDAGADAGTDAGMDAGMDAGTDAGADAGPTSCDATGTCPLSYPCDSDATCESGHCSNGHCAPPGFVFVPAGTFLMGAPLTERGLHADRENGQHWVELTRPYFIGETAVTQAEYERVMGLNPSYFQGCGPDCPVEMLNFWEMLAYLNARSRLEGLAECFTLTGCVGTAGEGCDPGPDNHICPARFVCDTAALGELDLDCEGYRMPTESEWERAARAGTETPFLTESGNLTFWNASELDPEMDRIAWYVVNSEVSYPGGRDCRVWNAGAGANPCGPHPVGLKEPNRWGLYDVTGQVWERVWDWSGDYPEPGTTVVDPVGPPTGVQRRMRGGSFANHSQYLRVAYRTGPRPEQAILNSGFRIARTAPPPPLLPSSP